MCAHITSSNLIVQTYLFRARNVSSKEVEAISKNLADFNESTDAVISVPVKTLTYGGTESLLAVALRGPIDAARLKKIKSANEPETFSFAFIVSLTVL